MSIYRFSAALFSLLRRRRWPSETRSDEEIIIKSNFVLLIHHYVRTPTPHLVRRREPEGGPPSALEKAIVPHITEIQTLAINEK